MKVRHAIRMEINCSPEVSDRAACPLQAPCGALRFGKRKLNEPSHQRPSSNTPCTFFRQSLPVPISACPRRPCSDHTTHDKCLVRNAASDRAVSPRRTPERALSFGKRKVKEPDHHRRPAFTPQTPALPAPIQAATSRPCHFPSLIPPPSSPSYLPHRAPPHPPRPTPPTPLLPPTHPSTTHDPPARQRHSVDCAHVPRPQPQAAPGARRPQPHALVLAARGQQSRLACVGAVVVEGRDGDVCINTSPSQTRSNWNWGRG